MVINLLDEKDEKRVVKRRELVSVIIPCYRSENTICKLVNLTLSAIQMSGRDAEFILVNDYSPDGTYSMICTLVDKGMPVIGVDLARNFGQHSAIMAGLHYVSGDIVLLMDDDMQTHPSQVSVLLQGLDDSSVDVVFGRYPKRKEAFWRRVGSAFTRWTMRVMVGMPKGLMPSSFIAMRRSIAETMIEYTGPYPFITGLVFQSTSHVGEVSVQHFERESGSSGYTFKSLVRLWMTIMNFSMAPLRLASALGAVIGLFGLIAAVSLIIRKLLVPETPVGWSSTMVTILVCSGLIIMFLGIVGEYVGRIFMTSNHVPQYIIRERIGGELVDNNN